MSKPIPSSTAVKRAAARREARAEDAAERGASTAAHLAKANPDVHLPGRCYQLDAVSVRQIGQVLGRCLSVLISLIDLYEADEQPTHHLMKLKDETDQALGFLREQTEDLSI